jgi:predicted dehydrogenase
MENLTGRYSDRVELVGCADVIPDRAADAATEFGLRRVYSSVEELLGDSGIDAVLNLTVPAAHYEMSRAAVDAGKHVYAEKPLTVTLDDGRHLLEAARTQNVRVGCAPDTFLGGGLQTCRRLLDEGAIGTPVAATAFFGSRGPEMWHPSPGFFYKAGGGPMFDLGPYYLTALVSLLGPIRRVSGSTRISFPERTIGTATSIDESLRGTQIQVEVPTHIAGTMDFHNGVIASVITSFDMWGHNLPLMEIYGSEGTLSVPDPNTFGGEVRLLRPDSQEWEPVVLSHGHTDDCRGLGLADMAAAIANGTEHRASGQLAYHVLEAMHGFHIASDEGMAYAMRSTCARPEPLPADG